MSERRFRGRRAALVAAAVVLLVAGGARSADDKGQYAVRGAGLISCALYVQERAAQDDVYLMTAAWIDGYITGINQYAEKTYDLLSFESAELLLSILDRHCRENPTDAVFGVLTSLFEKKLWQDRVAVKSDKVDVVVGEREVRLYVHLIERVQDALRTAGWYAGPVDGAFSPMTEAAVKRYQSSIGFEATGFPDQLTLWRLLRTVPAIEE